jgi:NAD(P)-dependent dehydrogenase (short-subunit alcohol dehydrogenase family)
MDIAGKVFIVTGGASGLGEGSARMLAAAGGKVVIADVQVDRGQAVADDIGGAFVRCDVSQEADAQAVVERACALGKLVGLVNCAGVGPAEKTVGKTGPHSLAMFSRVVQINLIGTFNMLRLAADAMSRNAPEASGERGVVVNTASVAAYDGQIGQAAYSASKGGVVGMTLPIARDLARNGIRVMTIAPGIFATPMVEGLPQEVRESLAASVPFPWPNLAQPLAIWPALAGSRRRWYPQAQAALPKITGIRPRHGHPYPLFAGTAVTRRPRRHRWAACAAEKGRRKFLWPVPFPHGKIAFVHCQPFQAVFSLLWLRQERQRHRLSDGTPGHVFPRGGQRPGPAVRSASSRGRPQPDRAGAPSPSPGATKQPDRPA